MAVQNAANSINSSIPFNRVLGCWKWNGHMAKGHTGQNIYIFDEKQWEISKSWSSQATIPNII